MPRKSSVLFVFITGIFISAVIISASVVFAISTIDIAIGNQSAYSDVTVFVYPDYKPYEDFLDDSSRLDIAVYTFTNTDIAENLVEKAVAGIEIGLMVENRPQAVSKTRIFYAT